jgi:hypothetical protein
MTRDRFLGEAEGNPFFAESLLRIAELADLEKRFIGWKRTIVGHSKEELKGQDLSANQLYAFVHKVLPPTRPRNIHHVGGCGHKRNRRNLPREITGSGG